MVSTLFHKEGASRCPFTAVEIAVIVRIASRYEKKIKGIVEIAAVGDRRIQALNRQYRGKDRVTDVLSFAWTEEKKGGNSLLAQIYLGDRQIARQAKQFGESYSEEFIRMLIHGLLHSIGYDHEGSAQAKKMFALQEKIVARGIEYLSKKR